MKTTSYTENKDYGFNSAPRCGANTKSNNGNPCRCPAVKGKARCRVHGGARGSGAPRGNVNALKHGNTTAFAKGFREEVKRTIQLSDEFLKKFRNSDC